MWQARQSAPSYQTDQQPQAQAQSQQQQQNSAPIWQKYDKGEKIGEGTYGWVYHARNKETGKRVALKQFKAGRDGDGLSHTAIREIMLLRELNHENVVRLDSVHIHRAEPCLWLAFDYAEHDLYEMIKFHRDHRENQRVNPTGLMPHHVIKSVMWQLLNGLSYMHQNWVIHRDLKPSNVLVMAGDEGVPAAERGSVRIADFGLARFFQLPLRPLSDNGVVVTIWYRAPELLLGSRHYTRAVDVWAAGCILAELCALRPLFQGQERKQPGNAFQGDQLDRVFRVLGHPNTKCWPDLHALPHWHDNTDNVRVKKPEYPSPPAWAAGSGPQVGGGGSSTAAGGGSTGAHQQPQQQQQAPHHGSSAGGSSAAYSSAQQQQQAQQQHSPAPGAGATAATPASNASAAAGGKAEGYVAWAASQLEAAVLDAMRSSLPLWARGRVPEECRPPPEAFHLLALMLDYNPNTRITAEQALAHPYFTRCTPLPTPNVFCAPGSKEPTIRYTTRTVGASAHQGGAHGHDGAGGGAHPPSSQQPSAGGGRPPAGAAGMHGSRFGGGVGPPPAGRVSASAAAAAAAALGNPHAGASRKRKGEPLPGFR